MNPTTTLALYLLVLALAIKFLLGAVQSGTFNNLLARFGLPPIPTNVFPWVGLVLGLGAGIVEAVQQGDIFANALAKALIAMLTGAISAAHLEFISGRAPVLKGQPPAAAAKFIVVPLPPAADDQEPLTPPTTKRLALVGGLALFILCALFATTSPRAQAPQEPQQEVAQEVVLAPSMGCGWFSANVPTLATYTAQDLSCVLSQLFTAGAFDPAVVVIACAPLTLQQLVAILSSLLNYYLMPPPPAAVDAAAPEAGTGLVRSSVGEVCGFGPPPNAAMPRCIQRETLLRVMTFHVAVKAQLQAAK